MIGAILDVAVMDHINLCDAAMFGGVAAIATASKHKKGLVHYLV